MAAQARRVGVKAAISAIERSGGLLGAATGSVFALALILGGGRVPGLPGDIAVQLAALAVIPIAALRLREQPLDGPIRRALALAGVVVALPLVQLIPLPPEIWTRLPGRSIAMESFAAAGLAEPWWPLSLDPAATWRSFLTLLAPLGMFLAVLALDARTRRYLTLIALALGLGAVILGLLQLMQGSGSPLRFYEITNRNASVGFFANRNHHAAFLSCLIPFAVAWTTWLAGRRLESRAFLVVLGGLVLAALLLGAVMTFARAGVGLAVMAFILSLAIHRRGTGMARSAAYAAWGAGALAGAAVIVYALPTVIGTFGQDHLADYRFEIMAISLDAARAFFPVGAGFGTFETVYLIFDRPQALNASEYVNHAHNDWLELIVEGGLLALLAAAAFLGWFAVVAHRIWRHASDGAGTLDTALQRAATIAIVLLMLHSLVEFPLRSTAMLIFFAMCCALLVRPVDGWPGDPAPQSRRQHRRSARRPRRTPNMAYPHRNSRQAGAR